MKLSNSDRVVWAAGLLAFVVTVAMVVDHQITVIDAMNAQTQALKEQTEKIKQEGRERLEAFQRDQERRDKLADEVLKKCEDKE